MEDTPPPSDHTPAERRPSLRAELVDDELFTAAGSRRTEGLDVGGLLALTLAISSWIVLPIIGAIAALLIAPGAKRRIRNSNGALTGDNLVVAAQVIAILNLLLGLLVVWAVVALIRWMF